MDTQRYTKKMQKDARYTDTQLFTSENRRFLKKDA